MKAKHSISSIIDSGHDGLVVDIQCQLSNNLPSIVIVGYANKAVDEAKERIRSAFSASNIPLPRKRITINLAPADIPKDSTGFDLAIAAAILYATGQANQPLEKTIIVGELGLDGDVRAVRGVIGKVLAGKRKGFTTYIIPKTLVEQAALVPGIVIIPVESLSELSQILSGDMQPKQIETSSYTSSHYKEENIQTGISLEDVVGQPLGKRAIQISAAGGHNILLGGPPGTGKSMLAKILPTLLPSMSREEMLEVTHLHSLANNDFSQIITTRPFRSPHHSASNVAIVGGGNSVRPGEMSLAHKGVLLFDELPEFSRVTVEALRQPLESRTVTIARAKATAEYPADFIFIGTANPCPCGFYGTKKICRCAPSAIERYRRKLSGPILDRIDIYVDVHEIDNSQLLVPSSNDNVQTRKATQEIAKARTIQNARFSNRKATNATMTNREIKAHANMDEAAKNTLDAAASTFSLSARAYMRAVKVARTIADLDDSEYILQKHIAEALQYRPHQFHEN